MSRGQSWRRGDFKRHWFDLHSWNWNIYCKWIFPFIRSGMDPVPSHVCPLCPQQSSLSTKVAQRMSFGLLGRGAGAAARCEFVRMKGPGGKGHAEVRGDGRVSLCLLEEITQNLAVDSATPKTGINIQLFCCTTSRWLCLVRARPACTRRALNRDSPPRSCGTATGRMTRMTCSCIDIRYTIICDLSMLSGR